MPSLPLGHFGKYKVPFASERFSTSISGIVVPTLQYIAGTQSESFILAVRRLNCRTPHMPLEYIFPVS